MENKIFIAMEGEQKMLTVRSGTALELKPPLVVDITGDIHAVSAYINKRHATRVEAVEEDALPLGDNQPTVLLSSTDNLQAVETSLAVIIFNKTELSIQLLVNPTDFYAPKITGKMDVSDELKPWGINEQKEFNREQIVKLIRFSKSAFDDGIKHDEVLKALQSLSLSGTTKFEAGSDNRGNKNIAFDKKLVTDKVPTDFYLRLPIFKGFEHEKFLVELCISSTEHTVVFWFESVELKVIQDKLVAEQFNAQATAFNDFVIINK